MSISKAANALMTKISDIAKGKIKPTTSTGSKKLRLSKKHHKSNDYTE